MLELRHDHQGQNNIDAQNNNNGCKLHEVAVIEARPLTGRTHQIRVHLASQGLPIIGDELYGAKKTQSRIMLHAACLTFVHPVTGKTMCISAPLPEGF